jgi:predicted small metal-binding protein
MKMRLSCRAMGLNCDFVAFGDNEEEIKKRIADHLEAVHRIPFTDDLNRKAGDLVRLAETS